VRIRTTPKDGVSLVRQQMKTR